MVWARAALVGGLLVLCAAFAIGTENQQSTMVSGQHRDCGAAISASWLVSGTPDLTAGPSSGTADERRIASACTPVIREARVAVVTTMCAGGLMSLVGLSALRRPRGELEVGATYVRA